MRQGYRRVSIVFFIVFMCDAEAAGNNGDIQIPKTGEYCVNYFNAVKFEYYYDLPFNPFREDNCQACWSTKCPWVCNWGCVGTFLKTIGNSEYYLDIYEYTCSAGCVSTANCNPPIANASHTGPGTVNNDPNSCPFNCNAGFYLANGVCVPCQTCDAGKWLRNCTGSDAGTCVSCDN
jgi:hypothetical protein